MRPILGSPLRFVPEESKLWKDSHGNPIAIVEVTIRTLQSRFLMRPCTRSRSLILGVIAKAQEKYPFPLFGYAWLSNHGSMLLGVRSAAHLSRIMNFVHSNIARELGRKEMSDWRGKFFERRGRAILVLSDEDVEARLKYLLANGTKEGLVARPDRWPGAHCARVLCHGGRSENGIWIDRGRLHGLPKPKKSEKEVTETLSVRLSAIPSKAEMSSTSYREYIRRVCREVSSEAAEERQGKGPLGAHRVERMHPHHKPEKTAHSPAPLIHAGDDGIRHNFKKMYRAFVTAFREARDTLVGKIAGHFPEGGLPPLWQLE